jgi:hypothetical protein
MGPLLAGWWAELGLSAMSSHAHALIRAVNDGDWPTVHRIAEHVSLDVAAARERNGQVVYAASDDYAEDICDGWGLLGVLR